MVDNFPGRHEGVVTLVDRGKYPADHGVIALCGLAGDPRSVADANFMAASPRLAESLLECLAYIINNSVGKPYNMNTMALVRRATTALRDAGLEEP